MEKLEQPVFVFIRSSEHQHGTVVRFVKILKAFPLAGKSVEAVCDCWGKVKYPVEKPGDFSQMISFVLKVFDVECQKLFKRNLSGEIFQSDKRISANTSFNIFVEKSV